MGFRSICSPDRVAGWMIFARRPPPPLVGAAAGVRGLLQYDSARQGPRLDKRYHAARTRENSFSGRQVNISLDRSQAPRFGPLINLGTEKISAKTAVSLFLSESSRIGQMNPMARFTHVDCHFSTVPPPQIMPGLKPHFVTYRTRSLGSERF